MSWNATDISFKKLNSKRISSSDKTVFEEIGVLSLDIHNNDIKVDTIPSTPPVSDTSVVKVYSGLGHTLVQDLTVTDGRTFFASIFNASGEQSLANQTTGTGSTGRLFHWISDKYDALGTLPGTGYEIKLYDKDGVQITSTDASRWYFDYQTGILIFQNANTSSGSVASRKPYSIAGYRYIGGFGITGGTGGTGSGNVGTGYTTGIAYYTDANNITSSSTLTWDVGSSTLTLSNSTLSLIGSTINSGTWAGDTIGTLYGGTGLNTYAKGDLLVGLGGTLITLPVGTDNYFLTADSATDSGLNWVSGLATTGIVSINNLDSIAQSLVVGTSGIKFNIDSVSLANTHIFNLPDAGVGITGVITGEDQTIAGSKSFTDNLLIRSGSELRLYSDLNLYYTGLKSVATGSVTFILPSGTGTSGQVLYTDGSGILDWTNKGVSIGETPPVYAFEGDLWWDSSVGGGSLYIYYNDGTSYQWVETTAGTGGSGSGSVSGSGISSLNGLTNTTQIFSVGFSGNNFNISSLGSSHTFNLPYASQTAAGILSTTSQNVKGIKSFIDGAKILSGNELRFYNSSNLEYTGFKSVASTSITYNLPATGGTNLQALYTDGSGGLGWTFLGDVTISETAPVDDLRQGKLWWDSTEGNLYIYYFDGTSYQWIQASTGVGGIGGTTSGGIQSLNGLTELDQFFITGYSGTEFNISSSGSTHTFNIPLAGNGSTGLISPDVQTLYGLKIFNNGLQTLNQTGLTLFNSTNSNYVSIQSASGTTVDTSYFLPITDGTPGYALKTDGSGNLYWGVTASGTASIGVSNVLPTVGNTQGDLIWHTEEGTLKIWFEDEDTSQWVDASRNSFGGGGTAVSGLYSLNGITESTQTFSVGTSGNLFNISSIGSSHTFNIPIAGNGITGLIDSDAQTIYGAKTFDSDLYAINNIYVSKDNYIGGVPADFTVGGSTGVVYFGIAKDQNITRFAGMKVEEISSPLGGGNLNGEVVFYTDSETQDFSTERLRITGFGTVISSGPVVISSSSGSATTTTGDLTISGGAGIAGTLNATSIGVRDLTALFSANLTTSATTANQVLHTLPHAEFKTAKYVVQCISGSDLQAQELLLIHDGTNVYMTEYSQVLGASNIPITTYDARISGSSLELLVTPVNSITTYVASCTAIRG
jgi:hypothetical protein